MSVQKLSEGGYKVRWREMGRARSKNFDRKRDADDFDAEIRRRLRMGEVGIVEHGRMTLAELHASWIATHQVARSTRESYESTWRTHIEPKLGRARLAELTPEALELWIAELTRAGLGRRRSSERSSSSPRCSGSPRRGAGSSGTR